MESNLGSGGLRLRVERWMARLTRCIDVRIERIQPKMRQLKAALREGYDLGRGTLQEDETSGRVTVVARRETDGQRSKIS